MKKTNIIYFLGSLQFVLSFALLFLSFSFKTEIPLTERPVIIFVGILIILSLVYLSSVYFRHSVLNIKKLLFFIFVVGLLIRVIMIFSVPVLEDDFNRYLWDGAVTGNLVNPYIYSPEDVSTGDFTDMKLAGLMDKADEYFKNINHPHLKTIYPPVAQLVFAVSYKLGPFNLKVWKIVLLFFDILTFFLLLYSLRSLGIPSPNILVYWWNPILINEIFVSGHMEVIAFPFVLLAIILAGKKYVTIPILSLAAAAGVKLWPVFLFPLVLKSYFKNVLNLVRPALLFSIFLAVIFLPLILVNLDSSSGLVAYSRSWENNSSLFRIFLFGFEGVLKGLDIHPGHAQSYTRYFLAFLTIFWVVYQSLRSDRSMADIFKRSLFIVAAIFLISPTQFPWYYTWLLPFLAIAPRFSLLLLTVTLPLYYLRYYLEPRGMFYIFSNYIVWIEFVPVWILIIMEYRGKKLLGNI